MEHRIRKILYIDTTLNSSESLIFTKGGKNSVKISLTDEDLEDIGCYNEIYFTVQMEKSEQHRYDFGIIQPT